MKTLVVLSALVVAAIAAPALLEDGLESHGNIPQQFTETFRRDRKSTLDSRTGLTQNPGTPALQQTPHSLAARSLILKKPIIVKKKEGYHVYRDSDEEQADSRETCVKQVKVKLCDDHATKGDMARNVIEDPNQHMTEDDMKHSIKLAKEAVENLQRDLKKAEQKSDDKALRHDNSESDTELHHDIEVARQALEHIHQNFGNLESMSLHSSLKDVETKDNEFVIAKTEEERLAQWKEAVDNINRNAEIARNIEDSFKVESDPSEQISEDAETTDSEMRKPEESHNKDMDHKLKDDEELAAHKQEKSSTLENKNTQLLEDDMHTSPSIALETKMLAAKEDNTPLFKDAAPHDKKETETVKNAEMETSASKHSPKIENIDTTHLTEEKERNTEAKLENLQGDLTVTDDKTKSAEHKDTDSLKSKLKSLEDKEKKEKSAEKKSKQELKTEHEEEVIDTSMFVKSVEQDINKEKDISEAESHAQDLLSNKGQSITEEKMAAGESVMIPSFTPESVKIDQQLRDSNPGKKAIEDIEDHDEHHKGMMHQHHHEGTKHEDHQQHHDGVHQHQGGEHHHPENHHSKMATTDSQTNVDHQRWAHGNHLHVPSMKAAEEIPKHAVETLNNHQFAGHQHHMEHMRHHPNNAHIHPHPHHSRFSENFMVQGKSADMEGMQPSYYMRDTLNMGSENSRLRWMPTHETSRSAYGPPAPASAAASSGGAVGLFPNANVGGCGIPLLLSCNPSVVSGSLAKPHSYTAPSYRSEDDFNFHAKRDIKANEKMSNVLNRNPTLTKSKITTLSIKQ